MLRWDSEFSHNLDWDFSSSQYSNPKYLDYADMHLEPQNETVRFTAFLIPFPQCLKANCVVKTYLG